mgnify:FL=1
MAHLISSTATILVLDIAEMIRGVPDHQTKPPTATTSSRQYRSVNDVTSHLQIS